ncbi:hypothetical protein LPTSP3_g04730 [Leptospira kobayashii]|uniref:Lipoprotein n=1 Tax=Leptospira kobayashii TaxID=1917830 RepID=A0ABN6K9Q5_9LEPT|nr:hypothetical protein [Leptospira kobayashii]BDA77543.1 hypothetical protein LPTSP3_g04730 [Leptospira kobayashii]
MKKHLLRISIFGVVLWIVPFFVSFGFYSPEGKLQGDLFLFKTTMILVGSLTGCYLLYRLAKLKPESALITFTGTGILWFVENIVLDFLILIPMSKMSLGDYFVQIGLRYLTMIFIATTVGASIEAQKK